ncbi:MAG: UDP-N-acetylmuramoyl-tripeptide--D-alanyl-D-alanine ligase [Candidatus Margulisiibacteriota bacterium]
MFSVNEILGIIEESRVEGSKACLPVRQGRRVKGISTDSRTVRSGELFIPLVGPKFDGRKFIPDALKAGALILETKDGLKALQAIAAYHRAKFKIPVIGITGSVGKTTTKDMLAAILSKKMPTLKSEENFNNEIGVPLTLLRLNKKHKAAVIEMGMQKLGEIDLLANIARPTIAVITNIGESHMAFLKSKKNIAKAKAEIFNVMDTHNYAVINQDDEYFEHLLDRSKKFGVRSKTFGIIAKADITPKELEGINLPIPGEHNIYNALAAIAVAKILKIPNSAIKSGLESFRPSTNRYDVINREDKVKIINDTYNASPQSMSAVLKILACLPGRKIAILGDMFELGAREKIMHKKIGELSRKLGIDYLFSVGKLSREMKADFHFASKESAIKKLRSFIRPGDRILIKASHGMHFEEIVEALRKV